MDIPPVIRVTLNAAERHASPETLLSFARIVDNQHRRSNDLASRESSTHTEAPVRRVSYKSLECLVTLGVDGTIAFIQGLLGPPNGHKCLQLNVAALSEWTPSQTNTKVATRARIVLENRIGSIVDLLSLKDTAKLIYAIANIDTRMKCMNTRIVEHFMHLLSKTTVTTQNTHDFVISLALVLTSLELTGRATAEQLRCHDLGWKSKAISTGTSILHDYTHQGDGATRSLERFGEPINPQHGMTVTTVDGPVAVNFMWKCGEAILTHIANLIKYTDEIDTELLVLLTRVMASISIPAPTTSEIIIRKVNVEELNETQVCEFIHACALAINVHQLRVEDVIEKCTRKIDEYTTKDALTIPKSCIAQTFHAFYLTGNLDTKLMDTLANSMASNKVTLTDTVDFYRTAIPLAITGRLSSENVCLWLLNQLASSVDAFSKETAHFLFLITCIANNIKVVWKKRERLPLQATTLETDIYEKAETYLRQQEGEKTYFSSPRAAILFLIERANALIMKGTADEFVQILLLNCARNFKPDSRIKFELLNECKRRVKSIPCGAIPQVLQAMFTLFSPNAPELIETFTLYLDRIILEITLYNSESTMQSEGNKLFTLTFLEDINLFGNLLSILDRCNLNRADLATQVIKLLERHNYKQLEKATFQALIDVLHYLAFSLDHHDAIDVVAILIHQRLKEGGDVYAGQLAAIAECFIAAPLALNPLRHQALIQVLRCRANESRGNKKQLERILNKLQ